MITRVSMISGVLVSTPPPVRFGRVAPLTIDPAATPAPQTSGKGGPPPPPAPPRDIGVSVVCMCWHVKRWFILCVCALQSEHIGVGCVYGEIL